MGKNQGITRLQNGFVRKLTPSEKARRYVYITMDINFPQILDPEFELFVNNISTGFKKIDKYGRITGMTDFVSKANDHDIKFQTKNKNLHLNY